MKNDGKHRHTAIIGAGPSGLAALKNLKQKGIRCTTYEAGSAVGGQWVLENSSGMSSAYRSLRTNTHTGMCRYADFEFPADYPSFPDHTQMAWWFDSYAKHFELFPSIRLNTRVESVQPRAQGGYKLQLQGGETVEHDSLIVATGNLWDPNMPDWPGQFSGQIFHAAHYLDPVSPVDCRDKRVLVVGLGNTACELAVELSGPGGASKVLLSARSGQYIIPKRVAQTAAPLRPPYPAFSPGCHGPCATGLLAS